MLVERNHSRVQRLAKPMLPNKFGEFKAFVYRSDDGSEHIAYIPKGRSRVSEGDPVRVHTECLAGDAFGSKLCDCASKLHESMEYVNERGLGVVIYIRDVVGKGIALDSPTLCRMPTYRDSRIAESIANDLKGHL